MISLSSIFQMRHGLSKKEDGMPKKYDPKKRREKNGHINVHEKKEREEKKIYI